MPPPVGVRSTGAGFEFTRRNKKADCHILSLFANQSSNLRTILHLFNYKALGLFSTIDNHTSLLSVCL